VARRPLANGTTQLDNLIRGLTLVAFGAGAGLLALCKPTCVLESARGSGARGHEWLAQGVEGLKAQKDASIARLSHGTCRMRANQFLIFAGYTASQ
jgi:hypothetical protein